MVAFEKLKENMIVIIGTFFVTTVPMCVFFNMTLKSKLCDTTKEIKSIRNGNPELKIYELNKELKGKVEFSNDKFNNIEKILKPLENFNEKVGSFETLSTQLQENIEKVEILNNNFNEVKETVATSLKNLNKTVDKLKKVAKDIEDSINKDYGEIFDGLNNKNYNASVSNNTNDLKKNLNETVDELKKVAKDIEDNINKGDNDNASVSNNTNDLKKNSNNVDVLNNEDKTSKSSEDDFSEITDHSSSQDSESSEIRVES